MRPLPVLLLLSLVSLVAPATLLVISGQITCRLNRPFSYRIVVIEEDLMYDQVLKAGGVAWFESSPSYYNISAVDTTDFLSPEYELRLKIHHDCSSNGDDYRLNVRYDIGEWPITHGTHFITYNMDVTDQGNYWPGAIKKI